MTVAHTLDHPVSFGDCDPAGIVSRAFAMFDRTSHDWLRRFGGHGALCRRMDAVGVGLMEAGAQFQRPMRDGDVLWLTLSIAAWSRKSLRVSYEGRIDGQIAVSGFEVRGLFKQGDAGIVAAEIEALRLTVSNGQGQE